MKEVSINYHEMEWSEATGYPAGTKMKLLREQGSAKTFLLKLPAGFDMEAHAHIAAEQHFVLEGGNMKAKVKNTVQVHIALFHQRLIMDLLLHKMVQKYW